VTLGLRMAAMMVDASLGAVKGLEDDLMTLLSVGNRLINGTAGVFREQFCVFCVGLHAGVGNSRSNMDRISMPLNLETSIFLSPRLVSASVTSPPTQSCSSSP
jgi:hypothetical protein